MKKFWMITLVLLLTCTCIACGSDKKSDEDAAVTEEVISNKTESSNDDEAIDAEDVIEKALEEAVEFESFSVEAVEYYLEKAAGLSLADVEPDWEWELKNEYCAYGDSPDSGYGHAVIQFTKVDGEVTEDEYQAWYQKVFDATAAVSQDGYNIIGYEFVGEGEDALAETTLEACLDSWMPGWCFRYNDTFMTVYVSTDYDDEKESELGNLFYYDSAEVDISVGLQKSWDDSWAEMEEYFEENEDEIKEALEDYVSE